MFPERSIPQPLSNWLDTGKPWNLACQSWTRWKQIHHTPLVYVPFLLPQTQNITSCALEDFQKFTDIHISTTGWRAVKLIILIISFGEIIAKNYPKKAKMRIWKNNITCSDGHFLWCYCAHLPPLVSLWDHSSVFSPTLHSPLSPGSLQRDNTLVVGGDGDAGLIAGCRSL